MRRISLPYVARLSHRTSITRVLARVSFQRTRTHLRRLLSLAATLGAAVVLLAPLLLGPALGPITSALGGEPEHRCACGMIRGQCGCPECARLEHRRLAERAPRPYPVLKSHCGEDETPMAFAGLPTVAPSGGIVARLAPTPAVLVSLFGEPVPSLRDSEAPPVPPPRTSLA